VDHRGLALDRVQVMVKFDPDKGLGGPALVALDAVAASALKQTELYCGRAFDWRQRISAQHGMIFSGIRVSTGAAREAAKATGSLERPFTCHRMIVLALGAVSWPSPVLIGCIEFFEM